MKSFNCADLPSTPETGPSLFLVLTPDLIIVAASKEYTEMMSTTANTITGRELLELFSLASENKNADVLIMLKASLQNVLTDKRPHQITAQKFYIHKPDGKWEEKYWSLLHTPVFKENGEIAYIVQNINDITTNTAKADKLKKSEFDYQLLVNSVRDYALFMISLDGHVASWNSGAEVIKGYTASEIVGKPIELFYTADDVKKGVPKDNLQTAIQNGHYETEGWRVKKNGDLFWANVVITALRDERGDLYGYSKITRDITEKKKAQNQIEFLSLQINQANDAIYTVDAAFKIKSWNKGAQKLYGFTVEEALGQDSNIILRTAISQEQINQILKEIANTDYWSGEIKRKTKEGRDIYVLSSNSTIRDQNGTIIGYTAVSFDITEQKRLREQVNHLAAIVEQSSEAIISRGLDQRLVTWNKGAEALFGYTKEEAIGKTAIELGIVKMTAEELGAVGQLIMETGKWKSERLYYHKNGSSFFGSVAANAVRNENGEVSAMVFIIKDISLHKQLEQRLTKYNEELEEKVKLRTQHILKTERRYRALIENNYDIISLMDESFNIIYRSPSAIRITGWTNEEMMNVNIVENIHPDDITKANDIVTELKAKPGKPINCLFRNLHKDGHYLWLEGIVINLLQDEYVNAIVFNFRDVTERIEAEEKRKASENRFRALIENSNDIITLMDENFRLIYRSPAATKVLGWTDEDMMGIEATTNIHPDDKAYATQVVKEVMANPGKTVTKKFRMGHKQGHYLWLEGMLTNLLQDQSVQAVVFNFRNITQRVEAEEKLRDSEIYFRTTLDNMLEGIQVIDFDWRYIYVNDALTRYSRYSSKELLGHTIMELYPGVEKADLYKSLAACMNERKPQRLETEFVFPDGSKADFELSMRPVPEGIFILSIDITEKKKAEQELKRTNERFELVVAATNDVIWDWNMIADTFWRNKNYYSHFGYDEQSIPSDTSAWHNGIHPDDKERVLAGINQCITNKHHFWSDEYRYLKADQTVASVLDCGYILYSNDDQAYRMVGAMLDITARKKAELDLKKSFEEKEALSERLSIILNTLPATIALLDSKGCIIEVNDAWRNFADDNGLTGSAYCIGHNYIEISKNATGNDKKDGKKVAKGITAVLNKEAKEFVFEYPCHSLHEERWFRMVVTPLHHKTYGGVVVMHTDISELRRLEQERLKSKTEEQRKITKAMLQGQEKERNAIGAELHDNVNQILVATKLFLSVGKTDPQKSNEAIGAAISNIQNAIDENRKIAHELVGPDMEAAYFREELLNLTTKMLGISGIEVCIAADNFREELLDNQRKLAAYRILQEQCTNIVKYAAAKKVNVGLDTSDQLFTMRIADDGKGMESGKISNGIGLKNIKGRLSIFNGTATITTSPGNGFVLETQIPIE